MRQQLALRLCRAIHAPAEVILGLASENISISRPLLTNSPVLSSANLIEITKNQSQEQLLAIATRQNYGRKCR
jgi:uncharacterized protein (DUF2336 family)